MVKGGIFEKDKDSEFKDEPEEFSEPGEYEGTRDDQMQKLDSGEKEVDVYSDEGREELVESGEIQSWEEGFAEGAEGKGHMGKCACCGDVLGEDDIVERNIDGKHLVFCSNKCAESGPRLK